ncbi:MAG: WYL domain-containing protein [Solibacillus sp.]
MEKEEQVYRILQIYDSLLKGEIINKAEIANKLEVNERTIQRDVQSIRNHLEKTTFEQTVINSRKVGGYILSGDKEGLFPRELLTVTKILLESRALNTTEMKETIEALLSQSTIDDSKFIRTIVGNELLHYQPLRHNQPLLDLIWDIAASIRNKKMIEIVYERMDQQQNKRTVKPVSILFSEYYFYLIAFIKNSEYQSPVIFRLDRIRSFKQLNEKFTFSEMDRFEEGVLRQRVQFMYSGQLERLQFIFKGPSLEAVLDRFPNGHIVQTLEDGWLVEAEIYGTTGSMMWLLSQGENVEVISPESLRTKMRNRIRAMLGFYPE